MGVRRERKYGHWRYRKQIRLADGRTVRIFGVPTTIGLPDTRAGAERAERLHLDRVLKTGEVSQTPPPPKECPKVSDFVPIYLDASRLQNKPASVDAKVVALRHHIVPAIGHLRLDQVTYAVIEDLKLALSRKAAHPRNRDGKKPKSRPRLRSLESQEPKPTFKAKSINNVLTVLRRMLVIARKRGLIATVPEIDWLKVPPDEFDFLDFEEADRLLAAVDAEWRTMVLVALRTGMRMGELIALRWQDMDLVAGKVTVKQNAVKGRLGTPKSGKAREIALSNDTIAALKAHRHLRGPLVFCRMDGRMLKYTELRHPLWRACRKAGLRSVQWHALRHSFASHLVMRGVPLKAVQDLLGHSTIQMTMRYAHLAPHVTREAVNLLDRPIDAKSVNPRGTVVAPWA
jgi:integrase